MTRRMICSDTFEDEFFIGLTMLDRVLWFGLVVRCADDQGRLQDNATLIRSQVFPADDITSHQVEDGLAHFAAQGKILRYQAGTKTLIQILNWWRYQTPTWAGASRYPAPVGWIDREKYHGSNGAGIISRNWHIQGGYQEVTNQVTNLVTSQVTNQVTNPVSSPINDVNVNVNDDVKKEIGAEKESAPPPKIPKMPTPRPKEKEPPKEKPKPLTDERTKHAAIQCVKLITGKNPSKDIYDLVIEELGASPDTERFRLVWTTWRSRGFNPGNFAGILEWYKSGIPASGKPKYTPPEPGEYARVIE